MPVKILLMLLIRDIPRYFSGFVNAPLLYKGQIIFLHQSGGGGSSPLSYILLNRLFKKGNISFWIFLNISMQISSGPGDLFECIDLILELIPSFVIGLSKSLLSFFCTIFSANFHFQL